MPRTLALALLLASAALAAPSTAAAAVSARGSVEQVHVTGARPGSELMLVDRRGLARRSQRAGQLGGAVFREREARALPRAREARPRALDPLGAAVDQASTASGSRRAATAT